MIRHLHPTDSPRLLPFKQAAGIDESFSLAQAMTGATRPFSAVKFAGVALSPRAWESCWIQTRRSLVQAIVRAGPRSGPLAWEVREFFVHRAYAAQCWDVLEQLAILAGSHGARRLFIRLPEDSAVFEQARRAGFAPVVTETLYRAASAADAFDMLGGSPPETALRPRMNGDAEPLFRLYCAATPMEARRGRGQTAEEWADACERPGKWQSELVLDDGSGHLKAHIQMADLPAGRCFSSVWSPNSREDTRALLSFALSGAKPGPAMTLVPSYDESLGAVLADAGFVAVQSYETLVKMLAVPVLEPGRAVAAVG